METRGLAPSTSTAARPQCGALADIYGPVAAKQAEYVRRPQVWTYDHEIAGGKALGCAAMRCCGLFVVSIIERTFCVSCSCYNDVAFRNKRDSLPTGLDAQILGGILRDAGWR